MFFKENNIGMVFLLKKRFFKIFKGQTETRVANLRRMEAYWMNISN